MFSLPDKPGPPAGIIQFKAVTADRITIAWEPVIDEGGAKVTHYIVEKRETSRVVWSIISDDMEECYMNVQKLIRGNEYVFRVRGVNKFGVGDPLESEPIIAKNAFGKWNTKQAVKLWLDTNNVLKQANRGSTVIKCRQCLK